MIKTTLFTIAVATVPMVAFAHTHPRPPQSLPMMPAHRVKTRKPTTDPFSGNALKYEHYLREASIDQVREKILASKYQIARYQKQIRGLGDQSKTTRSDHQQVMKAMQARMAALQQKLASLQAELALRRSHPSRRTATQSRLPFPSLKVIGLLTRNGIRSAWIRDGQKTALIANGQRFQGRVVRIRNHHLTIGHSTFSAPATGGMIRVSGRLQSKSSSGNHGMMPAPGSTPQSLSMMQRQGRQQIISALSHSS